MSGSPQLRAAELVRRAQGSPELMQRMQGSISQLGSQGVQAEAIDAVIHSALNHRKRWKFKPRFFLKYALQDSGLAGLEALGKQVASLPG